MNKQRKGILFAVFAVILVAVVYVTMTYPPQPESDLTGTIGGVEKAERYQATQISDEDICSGQS